MIGIGFIVQSKMPPLRINSVKAMLIHNRTKQLPISFLILCKIGKIRVRSVTKIIKSTAHIHIALVAQIIQSQIYRTAATVAGAGRNVTMGKQICLPLFRVEVALHTHIVQVPCPFHKIIHSHLGPICIKHFNRVTQRQQLLVDLLQRICCLARHKGYRFFVTATLSPIKLYSV